MRTELLLDAVISSLDISLYLSRELDGQVLTLTLACFCFLRIKPLQYINHNTVNVLGKTDT